MSKLSELYDFQYGKGNNNPDNGGEYPIYGSNGIIGGYDIYNSEDAPVIGHIGANCGEVVFARGKHYVTYNGVICKTKLGVDRKYAYYVLLNSKLKERVRGSAQPFISYDLLNDVDVNIHNKIIQKKIGDILWDIDTKIGNNDKINDQLEVIARTIYDYWFLQFNFPDENGKPYKSAGGKMVWNEELKRDIPEGWKSGNIADLGEIVAGGTPSTTHPEYYSEEGIAWITPNDLSNTNDKYISHGERDISQLGLHNSSAKVMPKGTVLLTSRAPIGYIGIAMNEVCTNQGFKSIVPYDKYGSEFVYYTVLNMVPYIKSLGTGSTFTEVSKEVISKVKIVIPQEEIVKNFNNTIITIGEKRAQAEKENKELASLRDFLLPLLMNGQVGFREC